MTRENADRRGPAKTQLIALLTAITLAGCVRHKAPPPAPPAPNPHYVLGNPYQANGHWYYPAESYSLDTTGIASAPAASAENLTADGEQADPNALTAAMQTIQLPAIAHVTNLENGREITLRVNDRGPASPARLIALSPRAALFLNIPPEGAARVRVEIDEQQSRRLIEQLGGGPTLAIQTAPQAQISAENLPPPGQGRAGPAKILGGAAQTATGPLIPDKMPERIIQGAPRPGELWLEAGSFGRANYANVIAARLAGLGADVVRSRDGRQTTYTVKAGPFQTIPQADAALDAALRAGVIDAKITVE